MKIGIDISQIVYSGTGVARFTNDLTSAILDYDNKNQWVFFFSSLRQDLDPSLKEKILAKKHELITWKLPPTVLSYLWNDLHNMFRFDIKPDWFITSDWTEPNILGIKKTTIVHDLVFKRFPETVHKKILSVQTKRLNLVKKETDIIFADSQSTKKDLINFYQINPDKIVVNYPGIEVIRPSSSQIKKTIDKYSLKKPFILSVGKQEPRKNLGKLIEAFNKIKNDEIDLVIVGPTGWKDYDYQSKNIKYLGLVKDIELYSLFSKALMFAYPSLWEGFGIPIVEAMKLGTPIVCSNSSSIAEISGQAALLFDPENTEDITRSIKKLIGSPLLRKELVAKGKEKSKIFTRKSYLEKLLNTLYDNSR